MDTQGFQFLVNGIVGHFRHCAPKRDGVLARDGIRFEYQDENTCTIYVDEEITPYMCYTNEPWVSKFWHGKQNPHLYWWNFAAEDALRLAEIFSGGTVEELPPDRVPIDNQALADAFQNKEGDYLPEDVWTHSQWINQQPNPYDLFRQRRSQFL